MEPWRDLDSYGKLLARGELSELEADFARRKRNIALSENAHVAVVSQLVALRWGPTRVPIFNCLLLASAIWLDRRQKVLQVVCWLVSIGVPVDGTDLFGTTALAHALSTKPTYDPEFAQLLLGAGGNINMRNRYGGTCAHEFCMVWSPDSVSISHAREALYFFLAHGGNLDIKDNDGVTPRSAFRAPWMSPLGKIAMEEDARRKSIDRCTFCGRIDADGVQRMRCERCKKAKYYAPPGRCQRADCVLASNFRPLQIAQYFIHRVQSVTQGSPTCLQDECSSQ